MPVTAPTMESVREALSLSSAIVSILDYSRAAGVKIGEARLTLPASSPGTPAASARGTDARLPCTPHTGTARAST